MFTFYKTVGQTVVGVGIDFADRLATGESIITFDVSASAIVSQKWTTGTKVLATLTGGTTGQKYTLTYSVIGSLGTVDSGQIEVTIVAADTLCVLSVNLKSLGLQPVAGEKLTAKIKRPTVHQMQVIDNTLLETVTDADGYAQLTVPQGAVLEVMFLPLGKLTVDTTGRASVDLAGMVG